MPGEKSPGKPTTRRYTDRRRPRRCGWSVSSARSWARDHGTVQRVAEQLGYGVESVRSWVRQADIDEGRDAGDHDRGGGADQGARAGEPGAAPGQRDPESASAFFAAELDRPQR